MKSGEEEEEKEEQKVKKKSSVKQTSLGWVFLNENYL